METEVLLLIFVGVSAFAFTVQCVAVWKASRSVQELSDKLARQSTEVQGRLNAVQDRLLEVSEEWRPLGRVAQAVGHNVEEISNAVRLRSADLDELIEEVIDLGREQVSKVDYLVTDTVQKFEQTTETIQKDVLRPAIEVSSFIKGIQAGIAVLFSRGTSDNPAQTSSDEEMFI